MIHEDAVRLSTYGKELFPRSTDAQIAALRDAVKPFPNVLFARDALKKLSLETGLLHLPSLKAMLDQELRRRNLTTEQAAKEASREREERVADEWRDIDGRVEQMSDEDLADLKAHALKHETHVGDVELTADAKRMLDKCNPRNSRTLRVLIVQCLQRQQVAHAFD